MSDDAHRPQVLRVGGGPPFMVVQRGTYSENVPLDPDVAVSFDAQQRENARLRELLRDLVEAENANPALMAHTIGQLPSECAWMQAYRRVREAILR